MIMILINSLHYLNRLKKTIVSVPRKWQHQEALLGERDNKSQTGNVMFLPQADQCEAVSAAILVAA